jgi:hypothetical protein
MSIATLLENPLDLSIAEIIQNTDAQFLVVSIITPVRMILATIFGVVALYFVWQMKRDFAEVSWFSLWPGVLITPVFGIISIVFFFGHQEKEFLLKERRAIVRGGIFGLHAQHDYPIPLNGRVVVTLRKELNRTDTHTSQYQYHYDVTVDPLPAMGFTVASDRPLAQDFAKKLAGSLRYDLVDHSEDLSR